MTSKTVSIDGDRLRTIARLALVKPNGLTSVDSRDLLEILRLAAIGMDTEAARVSAKNGGLGGWQCPACRTWTYLSSQCKCGHKRGSDETSRDVTKEVALMALCAVQREHGSVMHPNLAKDVQMAIDGLRPATEPGETISELERLRKLQETALALDDAVAEFGIDKPQYISEVYQAFHDELHTGHGAMHAVEPSGELERLRELQEVALALDDAVAEFGMGDHVTEAYQKFHDALHDGHGETRPVETKREHLHWCAIRIGKHCNCHSEGIEQRLSEKASGDQHVCGDGIVLSGTRAQCPSCREDDPGLRRDFTMCECGHVAVKHVIGQQSCMETNCPCTQMRPLNGKGK